MIDEAAVHGRIKKIIRVWTVTGVKKKKNVKYLPFNLPEAIEKWCIQLVCQCYSNSEPKTHVVLMEK